MKKYIFVLTSFCLILCVNVFPQAPELKDDLFDGEALLMHVKNLSSDAFEGRRTGTKGAVKARKYIINTFCKLQVKPLRKSYEQSFMFIKNKKEYKGVNILGLIKGTYKPNKYIVVSAHYDHEGIKSGQIYNGADDNASGVCALFSFAEYFKVHPPKHSVILVAFDAEELGLRGSRHYVNNTVVPSKNILLNINMDMISRSGNKELFVVGVETHQHFKQLFSSKEFKTEDIKILVGHDGYDEKDNWTYSSDHANFYKKGIPFLYFGVEDHEDYHEPTDDFENIHPEFYCKAVKQIITVFKQIDLLSF
ncbi:M28 family peptidase [Aestuariivivens marinum]|uniref:M28 family peptidase n=1 Tax=Aestuariivivens marinum TaxID=2913555 RepID=UPI001F5A4DEF|nr:M28 family peptidase [Aestuariivivens marinum]